MNPAPLCIELTRGNSIESFHYVDVAVADLSGKKIAIWGLAFKPETDDIREAPALTMIDRLLASGARIQAHDPEAMENVRDIYGDKIVLADSAMAALKGADALLLVTEWSQYREPDWTKIKNSLSDQLAL